MAVYTNSSLVTYSKLSPSCAKPRRGKIEYIIPHCIVGQWTAKQGCDYFANPARGASANYVVGKDGSIGLCVDESNRAWTTGGTDSKGQPIRVNGISGADMDHRGVTIEVASDTTHPYAVTDAAYEALIRLVADIARRNGIKQLLWKGDKSLVGRPDVQNLAVHRWFAYKACPGDYLYNRFGEIASKANALIGATGALPTTPSSPQPEQPKSIQLEVARYKDASFSRSFTVTAKAGLNLRAGAGTNKTLLTTLKNGTKVRCYGYYNKVGSTIWLYVVANGLTGYACKDYLK